MYRAACDDGEDDDEAMEQSLRVEILRYLDRSKHLASLEAAGVRYKDSVLEKAYDKGQNNMPSFTYVVELDMFEVADESDELCTAILETPLFAHRLFREVVHCSLVTLCLLPTVGLDQVQVVLRVSALPAEQCLRTDGANRRANPSVPRLLLLQGVVAAVTPATKYTRSAVSRCCKALCPGSAGQRVWGSTASARRCRFCNGPVDEVPRGRDVGEQVLAQMVRPDALVLGDKQPSVHHPVIVRFADDLARAEFLQPGFRYDVVVLAGSGGHAEAWGVRPWLDGATARVHRGLRSAPLPASVQAVWLEASAATDSPWAFAVALASQLGGGRGGRYPAHAFLHLKLGILLSLASQVKGPSKTKASGGAPGCAWFCAGPLVLARGGVCLLGSWDKWRRSSAATCITQALEGGKVTLERRDVAGSLLPPDDSSVPLQCAVWSYWCPGSWGKASDLLTLKTILNTLGAPILAEAVCDTEVEDICQHLINKAQRLQVSPAVSEGEMKEFITLVNAQPITLTDEATRLIRDYFVASRRVRPNCLPVTAVSTIAAMAEAHARISLRVEATWADVLLVVWMYEEAFAALFGPCLISPLPEICAQPLLADQIMCQMDTRLKSMKVWLENFIKSIVLSSLRAENDEEWV
ncbi:minichromosome maintenance domain-containing protein 2 [Thrips palmi]|uniref:Minichromosome maintenance domain-containing protein 2 n=1 Tax=Thrips palmi TaxID=161013 RepID=A0A6P8ZN51_THRPL|nr:minichromosome maintenance domain-containing protein 2 [Thrips palmi]